MRFLIAAALVLSCSLCIAEDLPVDTDQIKSLTVDQATKLVAEEKLNKGLGPWLYLNGLTSIDKDVAHELAKLKKWRLVYKSVSLDGLTSIDKDVAHELANFEVGNMYLDGLTSIDKDVAQELAKFKGDDLYLRGLTSIDKDVAHELAKFQRRVLWLNGLTSIDKDVAQELAKVEGGLALDGLTSVDKDVLKILKSNPNIFGIKSIATKKSGNE